MKAIVDGTVTEISSERWAAFEAFEKGNAKEWPQHGDGYWYIDADNDVIYTDFDPNSSIDTGCKDIGNIYRTKSEALAQVEKLKAKARIDKYIRDNGLEFVPDWYEVSQFKHFINHDVRVGFEVMDRNRASCDVSFWFAESRHAKQVIDNCTDDLKTLFGI